MRLVSSSLLALAVLAQVVHAEEKTVLVTPSAGARGSEIDRMLRGMGRKDAELGNGKQVWILTAEPDEEQRTLEDLRRRKLVQSVETLGWDVRRPLDGLPELDLTPEQEEQVRVLRALPTSSAVRVFRLPSPQVASEVLRYGLVGDAAKTTLQLTLDEGAPAAFARRDVRPKGESFSWKGLAPDGSADATLVVTPRGITGTVIQGKQLYSIRPLGAGLHAVVRVETRGLPADEPPSWRPGVEEAHDAPPAPSPECADKERRLDVVVAYTARAAREAGDIEGLIQLVERETNDAFEASGVEGRVRIVAARPVPYEESGQVDTDLAALRQQPALAAVRQEVARLGADVGVLLTGRSDYCGVASGVPARSGNDAFAVVAQGCAAGNYSFGHELGHLLGARHDPCTDATRSPFPFGHGYLLADNQGRTIMGYGSCCGSCLRLPLWANASLKRGGVALGDATCCDDHRALNLSFPRVAAFGCPAGR